jgi:anaerobic selenocysteine-containing dehydrogenase
MPGGGLNRRPNRMPDHPDSDEHQPLPLDRRGFLKWGAVAGGSALGGFGKCRTHPGGPSLPWDIEEPGVPAPGPSPLIDGERIPAACWHNCGGQRCLLLAYVVDGEVLAVKTDDTHPDTAHTPQMRACARGRAQQGQVFGPGRLRYPMKRRNWEAGGGRRELRGEDEWQRISWDEALDLTAAAAGFQTRRIPRC